MKEKNSVALAAGFRLQAGGEYLGQGRHGPVVGQLRRFDPAAFLMLPIQADAGRVVHLKKKRMNEPSGRQFRIDHLLARGGGDQAEVGFTQK